MGLILVSESMYDIYFVYFPDISWPPCMTDGEKPLPGHWSAGAGGGGGRPV